MTGKPYDRTLECLNGNTTSFAEPLLCGFLKRIIYYGDTCSLLRITILLPDPFSRSYPPFPASPVLHPLKSQPSLPSPLP